MAGISSKALAFGGAENKYKYNGKEEQRKEFADGSGLDLYDFGVREQDPQIGRWWSVDPLANQRDWLTPYNFVQNNPMVRIDPNGETDFILNQETGLIIQIGKRNNDPDRILKSNKKGKVKTKGNNFLVKKSERGKPKVAVDKISKGILREGMNFKTQNNAFNVGGVNQPTVKNVQDFLLNLSDHIGLEIKGYEIGQKGEDHTSIVFVGAYKDNTQTSAFSPIGPVPGVLESMNGLEPKRQFHTHLTKFSDKEKLNPSEGDIQSKLDESEFVKKFMIITKPHNVEY